MAGTGAEGRRAGVLLAVVLVAGAALTGCTSSKKSSGAPVTVTASTTASATGTGTAAASTSGAASTAAARKTPVKPAPTLPRCDTVLPATAVDKVVAHHLGGSSAFVVNQPDPTISQLARINCQYGLSAATPPASASTTGRATRTPTATAGAPVPQVEVSVSLYATKAAAAARIAATDSEWRSQGATAHRVVVGTHPATVLTGYGRPLLVLVSGVRTVAVSVRRGAVAANRVEAALTQIAQSALSGSGG